MTPPPRPAFRLPAWSTASARLGFPREDLVDGAAQLGRRERLQQDVVEAEPRRIVDDVGRAMRRHEHARHLRADRPGLLEDLESVHPGHLVVHDEEIERLLAHQLERRLAPVRGRDGVPERLQDVDAEDDHGPGIVDDEDLRLGFHQRATDSGAPGSGAECRSRCRLICSSRPMGIVTNALAIAGSNWVLAFRWISSTPPPMGRLPRTAGPRAIASKKPTTFPPPPCSGTPP